MSVKKWIGGIAAVVVVVGIGYGYNYYQKLKPFQEFSNPDKVTVNFRSAYDDFGGMVIKAPENTLPFKRLDDISLPETYMFNGEERHLDDLLTRTFTTGLLVAVDDTILSENYYQGEAEDDRHIMFSVSKSFVSALVGIALDEGHIKSIQDPVTNYLPELIGTGYDGVIIEDILQMSSGVFFNEDYSDPLSDVNRMGLTVATGGSLDEFATGLERKWKPGTYNNYVSVDTHVLGMLLTRTTGKTLTAYLQEKIWQPLGMEFDGYWLTDGEQMEMAMGGMNVALRDMARMGRLYLNGGTINGKTIVPESWVRASVTPNKSHVMPKAGDALSSNPFGYGYQWWIPMEPHGDFYAAGIYYQYIYIDPTTGVIVAKTSADQKFNDPDEPRKKDEQVAAFQAISAHVAAQMAEKSAP